MKRQHITAVHKIFWYGRSKILKESKYQVSCVIVIIGGENEYTHTYIM